MPAKVMLRVSDANILPGYPPWGLEPSWLNSFFLKRTFGLESNSRCRQGPLQTALVPTRSEDRKASWAEVQNSNYSACPTESSWSRATDSAQPSVGDASCGLVQPRAICVSTLSWTYSQLALGSCSLKCFLTAALPEFHPPSFAR